MVICLLGNNKCIRKLKLFPIDWARLIAPLKWLLAADKITRGLPAFWLQKLMQLYSVFGKPFQNFLAGMMAGKFRMPPVKVRESGKSQTKLVIPPAADEVIIYQLLQLIFSLLQA